MATKASSIEYLLDQLSALDGLTTRKMFGEYALYRHGTVLGFVCDDALFLKITPEGRAAAGDLYREGQAYPGSKPYLQADQDAWEDRAWLVELVRVTGEAVTWMKAKKRKPAVKKPSVKKPAPKKKR
ncbi:MAG: hypothetical protein RLZZ324_853 [Candidatus Parcubacteria bacterium]|jgi:TfoX/Sxy family transcriptional regulator of competence genes